MAENKHGGKMFIEKLAEKSKKKKKCRQIQKKLRIMGIMRWEKFSRN